MLISTRRAAAVTTATLLGALLPLLPLTQAAAADASTEVQVVLEDTNGDGTYTIFRRAGDGSELPVVPETTDRDVSQVDVSADGSRLVSVETSLDTAGNGVRDRLVVRDIAGRPVRTLSDLPVSGTEHDVAPSISPDGLTAVWTHVSTKTSPVAYSLMSAPVAAGPATSLYPGLADPVFLSSNLLLVRSTLPQYFGEFRTFALDTHNANLIAGVGIPTNANEVTLSPDGATLAWSLDTTAADATVFTADVQKAPIALVSQSATVQAATTLATGQENDSPAWAADGLSVRYVHWDGDAGNGDIWTVPADASAPPAVTVQSSSDELTVARGAVDTTGPGPVVSTEAYTLNGTSATLRWSLPSDPDLSGVQIVRTSFGNEPQAIRFVPAPLTSFVDTGLTLGQSYHYDLATFDRSSNGGNGPQRTITALRANPTAADPTSTRATKAPFAVTFATGNPASTRYTVTSSLNGAAPRAWVTATAGATRTFGAGASTGVAATTSTPGSTYRFAVRAFDAYGNSTATVTSAPTVVPFDQTRAALSGGVNVARGDAFLGTLRTLSRTTHYARLALTGNRVQVIGERCPSCGVMDVYDGSTRVASVDTRAAARTPRAVLYTRTWGAVGNHTITLRPRATAGRPNVVLDAFAVRR